MSLPALLGGTPIRPQGPPAWPPADPEILEVLQQAYRDGWWGKYQAGQCERLETWLREYHGVEHVLLCGSGNYAVELGLRTLGIGPGDEVILSDYDYPGNFLSIHAVGAMPVLVDVEPRNWQLSLAAVRGAVGPATKAILASHLHGGRVPMRELTTIASEKGLLVLEDAAQATGALIDGKRAGTWGDAGVLSFGGSKLLSAGRGGALLTSLPDVAQRTHNHLMRGQHCLSAVGTAGRFAFAQCAKLDERNAIRWANVQVFCAALDAPGVRPFVQAEEAPLPAFFKLGIQYDETAFGLPRDRLVKAMRAEGFAVDEGFAAAHAARSPKRFRQGSPLTESALAGGRCVGVHHPIFLEPTAWVRDFAMAWHRIQQHAEALQAQS